MSLVGNLEDLGLGEILQIVSLSRKSGRLLLHSRGREGGIDFRFGQVIRASSSTHQESLGEVLIRRKIVDLPTLKKALACQEQEGFKERLGAILIRNFGIEASDIEEVVREQIENAVYSLFGWVEGTFDFELQDNVEVTDDTKLDPMQFMLDQGLNPQFLAIEGSRIIDEKRHRGESLDEPFVKEHPPEADESVDLTFDLLHEPEPTPEAVDIVAKGMLVLVDDDEVTRESLSAQFSQAGYEVFSFTRSEDTLIKIDTLYRDGKRPWVLVDLIMPRMDGSGILGGLELLELVRNNFADLPVLVMSDYNNSDAERKVKSLGCPFILKPRKTQVADALLMDDFREQLLVAFERLVRGELTDAVPDNVNLGDELRLEMGEDIARGSAPAPQSSTGISLLRGMLDELNDPSLGGGITLLVLRFASEFMNRAVIFIVKRDEIIGLGQFGLQNNDIHADVRVRNLRLPRSEESLFSDVIDSRQSKIVKPEDRDLDNHLFEKLGDGKPAEIFLGPIVSEGKVVAVLYGDNLPDTKGIGDTDSLDIFLSQAGLAMEKALLQRKLLDQNREGT